jgi:hypothetical protein
MLAMAERRTERNARKHMRSSISSSNSHRRFAQNKTVAASAPSEQAKKI